MASPSPLDKDFDVMESLCQRTLEGSLQWDVDTSTGAIKTQIGNVMVFFLPQTDPEYPNAPDHVFELRDWSGNLLHSIGNVGLRAIGERLTADGSTPYSLMSAAYKSANRQARGIDKLLDDMLERLKRP